MPFPDVTFAPGTGHNDLLNKLQRFFVAARKYWITLPEERTIASASDPGRKGQQCFDTNYYYVCVDTDTWTRIPLTW